MHASHPTPKVVTGTGGITRIGDPTLVTGDGPAVVVVDGAVVEAPICRQAVDALSPHREVRVQVVAPHEPTADSVDAAAAAVHDAGAALVVGIGGGTALDTAKQAAVVAGGPGIEHYALGAHPLPSGRPVVAVPTTSGTGAEVTRTCVLTAADGRKVWTWGDELLPRLVVLDPTATATMPRHVTTATGLDAVVHAVEAVTGRRHDDQVVAAGCEAIALAFAHLPVAVDDGDDLDARQAMQWAALLAGRAIDGGGTGVAHSIGHALGTLAHVPHGVAVAVGLAAVLEWDVAGEPGAFEPVASALGRSVQEVPAAYRELLDDVDLGGAVHRVGPLAVSAVDLADAMVAEENRPMYANNCRAASDAERIELAEEALAVWDELVS